MRTVLAAAAGLLAAPGAALAADDAFVAGLRDPLPEAHLAGGGVVYVGSRLYRSDESQYLVLERAAGKRPRLRARIVPRRHRRFGWPDLDFQIEVSRAATVVAKEEIYDNQGEEADEPALVRRTLSAYAGGRRVLRLACARDTASNDIALAGETLATFSPGCEGPGLAVRDLSDGGRIVRRFEDADDGNGFVDIAGDFVAYAIRGNRLAVRNWRTGATLYEAQRTDLDLYTITLAADGTVASATEGCDVVLLDRAAPAGRDLEPHLCEPLLRLVGRRLAFARPAGGGRTRLEILDVDSGERRVVADLGASEERGFDFDGERLAWQEQRCGDYAIFLRDLGQPPHAASPARCPVRLGKARLRKRVVRVPFRCPLGCNIEVASLVTPRGINIAQSVRTRARPGGRGVLRFRLWREALRVRRARLEVTSYLPGAKRVEYRRRVILRR